MRINNELKMAECYSSVGIMGLLSPAQTRGRPGVCRLASSLCSGGPSSPAGSPPAAPSQHPRTEQKWRHPCTKTSCSADDRTGRRPPAPSPGPQGQGLGVTQSPEESLHLRPAPGLQALTLGCSQQGAVVRSAAPGHPVLLLVLRLTSGDS